MSPHRILDPVAVGDWRSLTDSNFEHDFEGSDL